MSALGDWAQYYASLGWAVFPLVPGTKYPIKGTHGSTDATTDPAQVQAWWAANPEAGIGMCPAKSGLYVLDVDPRNGGTEDFDQLQEQHGGVLASPIINRSGSGVGFHQFFREREGAKYLGKPAPGIDGKHRGFVVLPPSVHPSGKRYEWDGGTFPAPGMQYNEAPAFLERKPVERPANKRVGSHTDIPMIKAALAYLSPEDYLDWAMAIASVKHWGDHADLAGDAFEIAREWSAQCWKHDDGAFEQKWDDFDSYVKDARTLGSLIADARANGYQPGPDPASVFAQAVAVPTAVSPQTDIAVPISTSTGIPAHPEPDLSAFPTDSDQYQGRWFAGKAWPYFRYTDGMGWLSFDGARWVADQGRGARLAAGNQIQGMLPSVAPSKQAGFAGNNRLSSIMDVAKDFPAINVPAAAWDAEPMLLNTPVAAYDLRTGMPVDRSACHFTQVTAVSPDFNMPTPVWDRTIQMICPEWEFLTRALGYCLSGSMREELILIAYGSGQNGKSKLFETVKELMGDYSTSFSSNALIRNRNPEDVKELAKLRGKRMALAEEIKKGTAWDDEKLKNLTSASALTVKLMRENAFEVVAQQKVIVTTNYTPSLDGTDFALARRLALVHFPVRIEEHQKDLDLPAKLRAEAPGILGKLIVAARDWYANGLRVPASVKAAVGAYMAEHDDIQQWIDDCCVVSADARHERGALYQSYSIHFKAGGKIPESRQGFYKSLEAKNYRRMESNCQRYFLGICLKNPLNSPA